MGDLISRKALLKALEKEENECENIGILPNWFSISGIINRQLTAYDVEKVISQLSNKMFSAECYNDDFNGCEINNLLCMGDVYEIVKGAMNNA